jgi:hypothetical protein
MNGPGSALLIAFGAFTALLIAQTPSPRGSVEGTVVNGATGAGIGGATVTLVAPPNRYDTTSDATGHFTIAGMLPGNYRAAAGKDGYSVKASDVSILSPQIRIGSEPDPVKVTLTLTSLSTLHGRVLDPDGKPLSGVEVSFAPNLLGSVTTDREGRFTIDEVRPASYTLSARPGANAKPLELPDGTKTAMVTTYYPSVTDVSLAEKIEFRGDGDLNGYEIRMRTAPVQRVRGIVLNQDGKPAAQAEVSLLFNPESAPGILGLSMRPGGSTVFALGVRLPPSGTPETTSTSGPDGRFELPAVRAGDWRINADGISTRERGHTTVRVRRSDIDDVEIRMASRFNLTAAVEWTGEDRRPQGARILSAITLINSDGEFVRSGIEETGSLLFENVVPGQYRMLVSSGLSGQLFLGTAEVTNQVFPVIAGGPPLRLVLRSRSTSIRGTVEKGGGANVVLIPQGAERPAIGQSIQCAPDGSFEFSAVSPGGYYIAAFEAPSLPLPFGIPLPPTEAMLSLMLARGVHVQVDEASPANLTLNLIPLPK